MPGDAVGRFWKFVVDENACLRPYDWFVYVSLHTAQFTTGQPRPTPPFSLKLL
jgi:hypothetical protein